MTKPEDNKAPAAQNNRRSRPRRRRRVVPDNTVPSPCVAVCEYNDEQLCKGCLRTPDEIREWMTMSREEKLAVLSRLPQRRYLASR